MIAEIDLEKREVRIREVEDEKRFIGGKGLGFHVIEKIGAEHLIIFSIGPLTGLRMSGMARCEAVFKSPLTGFIADSSCGGYFGAELAKAGFLALIIKGRAKKPLLLKIDGKDIEFVDASHLWGKNSHQTEDEIKREFGRRFQIASIGQAGENLVRFASIEHAKGREFGRAGGGAVLGSMKLKAIAVRGYEDVESRVADYESYSRLKDELEGKIREKSEGLTIYGTPKIAYIVNEAGVLPSYYWRDGEFQMENISPEVLKEKFYVRNKSCYSCAVACGKISKVGKDHVEGPEYETLFAFGPLCGIDDPDIILRANMLCDMYGMDTVSTGNVISFLFHLKERGVIKGFEGGFGDGEKVLELIEKIAHRKDIGDLLAEGVARVSRNFGVEAVHVKGLEMPGYDPRGLYGMALGYAVCYRGACHIKSTMYRPNLTGYIDRFKAEGQAELLVRLENFYAFTDSLVICRFVTLPGIGPVFEEDVAALYSAVTGENLKVQEMVEKGGEIINLARKINEKLGLRSDDDILPEYFFKRPLAKGNSAEKVVDIKDFERMLEDYYRLRGWNC